MRNIITFIKLIYVIVRYRLWRGFYNRSYIFGLSFASSLEAMGPSYIKLGQTLSTRPDIIGRDIARALEKLQDKLDPFNYKYVEEVFAHDFGCSPDVYFKEINHNAIAAASVAQVHYAVGHDGKKYAVKVLRPGIAKKIEKDIRFFYLIAKLLKFFSVKSRRLKPVEVVDIFAEGIKLELDLRMEASAASELRENMTKDQGIVIPEIKWEVTSRNVITMEWIEGISISNVELLKERGYDLKRIASNLSVCFFNQAYRDGFFHADLHPGNLFVDENHNIAMVDFGIMGRLNKDTRYFVAEILRGFLSRDYNLVAKIHFEAGYVPKDKSVELFAQACRSIGEPIVGLPANKISVGKLLSQLLDITEEFSMETQPQLLLLQKNTVMLEGVGAMLDPEVNLWYLAEPWIEKWYIQNIGIETKMLKTAKKLLKAAELMPNYLQHFIDKYEKK